MNDEDKRVIVAFAKGDKSRRDEAIAIHRNHLTEICPENDFMGEIDNPCPDLALRHFYRERLVNKEL